MCSKNVERWLRICISYLIYSHIGLYLSKDDCHFFYTFVWMIATLATNKSSLKKKLITRGLTVKGKIKLLTMYCISITRCLAAIYWIWCSYCSYARKAIRVKILWHHNGPFDSLSSHSSYHLEHSFVVMVKHIQVCLFLWMKSITLCCFLLKPCSQNEKSP